MPAELGEVENSLEEAAKKAVPLHTRNQHLEVHRQAGLCSSNWKRPGDVFGLKAPMRALSIESARTGASDWKRPGVFRLKDIAKWLFV